MAGSTTDGYGLLMDVDGTAADTLPHLFDSFRYAVEPFVARLPGDAEIVATFGPPERQCIARMLADNAIARPGASEHLDEADRRFHAYYIGGHHAVKTFPGVSDVICCARDRGWRVGFFTGKGRRTAVFTLEQLGLWPGADCLVAGDDVRHPKPDPEGVRLALDRLGVRAQHLLVVGDTPADVEAGKAAGAMTVGALWGAFDPAATRRARPTWVLEQVHELRELIERNCEA